ncbi:hypothetical protein CU098_005075, partial [Rhizopus stolonifer]
LGDPLQLIRVIGSASKLYPDAEHFYYHENTENLMPWQGNPDIKIDRFDGRSLLDFFTEPVRSNLHVPEEDMQDELNFERYHDLIEAERLQVSESERLAEVEEEWTKLLDRHQAKLNMIKQQEKSTKSRGFGFDYGTKVVSHEEAVAEDSLLKQADILQYVDDLTDKDKQALNDMSRKYGIKSYARLLRIAKKDRDDELRSLKRKQLEGKPKENTEKRRRKRTRYRDLNLDERERYRRKHSPSYEPYQQGSSSSTTTTEEEEEEEDETTNDVVIEFGSSIPEEQVEQAQPASQQKTTTPSVPVEQKKLTPMEKLKLKMRQGLEKQIVSDEKEKRKKEREREIESLQQLAKNQGLPINAYLRPDPPMRRTVEQERPAQRYRSPSSSDNEGNSLSKQRDRSPSPKEHKRKYRSPSPTRRRHDSTRKKYRSPSPRRRRRYRSPSPRHRSPSPNKRKDRSRHYSSRRKSPSYDRRSRYRSPSTEDEKRK